MLASDDGSTLRGRGFDSSLTIPLPEVMEPVERYRNQTIRCMYVLWSWICLRGYGMKLGRCSVIMHESLSTLQESTFGCFLGEIPANISQQQQTSADILWAIYSLTLSSPFISELINTPGANSTRMDSELFALNVATESDCRVPLGLWTPLLLLYL